jgi:hypothetical protein
LPPARLKHSIGDKRDAPWDLFIFERGQRTSRQVQPLQFVATALAAAHVILNDAPLVPR